MRGNTQVSYTRYLCSHSVYASLNLFMLGK